MPVAALYEYAQKNANIPALGWSTQIVKYRVFLSAEGKITDIVALSENDWAMTLPTLPTGNQAASIVDPRGKCVFGFESARKVKSKNKPADYIFKCTEKAKTVHTNYLMKNKALFENLDSPMCKAYYNFLCTWDAEAEINNKILAKVFAQEDPKYFSKCTFTFGLDGFPDVWLETDEVFKQAYKRPVNVKKSKKKSNTLGVCALSGEVGEIARIHEYVYGPNSAKAYSLVNCGRTAYSSFGRTEGYNCNITEESAHAYAETFTYLWRSAQHHVSLNDMTILFFAMKKDDTAECEFIGNVLSDIFNNVSTIEANMELTNAFKKLARGLLHEMPFSMDTEYYVISFAENDKRIRILDFYHDTMGNLCKNVKQHLDDMCICNSVGATADPVEISKIIKALRPTDIMKNNNIPSNLVKCLYESVMRGKKYPMVLYTKALERLKYDQDIYKGDTKIAWKFTSTRVGILKAYLNRNARFINKKEEFSVALDKTNTNVGYLYGRLFAVLEQVQFVATKDGLNKKFISSFSGACTKPVAVFPQMLITVQYYFDSMKKTTANYYRNYVSEITDMLDMQMPVNLGTDMQSAFVMGYWHQYAELSKNRRMYQNKENVITNESEDAELFEDAE